MNLLKSTPKLTSLAISTHHATEQVLGALANTLSAARGEYCIYIY